MSDASQSGTVIHRSDVSTLPPPLQPAWKASPERGGGIVGGHMFSPSKLQRMFEPPPPRPAPTSAAPQNDSPSAPVQAPPTQREFTYRARHAPSSTPMPARYAPSAPPAPVETRGVRPPSTPGGPHVPLRLITSHVDPRTRDGLEQLVEAQVRGSGADDAKHAHASTDESSRDVRLSKRIRLGSGEPPRRRIPLSYRSTNVDELATPAPRSILKGGSLRGEAATPRASRSISFADEPPPRTHSAHKPSVASRLVTPRTARLDHVLTELEQLNVTPTPTWRGASPDENSATPRPLSPSFRITRDKLLEKLVDAAPWEPEWPTQRQIDLRARQMESCIGLSEYMPALEQVWLDDNDVSFAMGLPPSLRVLTASHNRFSHIASFEHLRALEVLDVSSNCLESLAPFASLQCLRELRADHNAITRLDGLEECTALRRLSLAHNQLTHADLGAMHWPALEHLQLAHNALVEVRGAHTLRALRTLDIESNALTVWRWGGSLPELQVLRLSDNAIDTLSVAPAPRLHTLYADRCRLRRVEALAAATELRSVSLRLQRTALETPLDVPPSIERLYLAGNALAARPLLRRGTEAPRLVYLELAGCQLAELPAVLACAAPALRTLNLDHNPLTALSPLQPYTRLKRVSVVGARINSLESIVRGVQGLRELCVLDTRSNPCTHGLYAPLVLPADDGAATALPPVPHPAVVQPDVAGAAERAAQARLAAAQALAERSQFHRRAMLVAPAPDEAPPPQPRHGRGDSSASADAAALFRAADAPFFATLPRHIAERRRVYRGLCGMACAALTWLDGLEMDEADVAFAASRM